MSMRTRTAIVPSVRAGLIAGMLCLAATAAGATDPLTGKQLAEDLCSGCHLVAEGQRGPVADGVPAFAALAADPAMTDDRLRSFIIDPHPPMPRVSLTAAEIGAIVAYIRSLEP